MGLFKLAAIGAAGYAGYRYLQNKGSDAPAAFASGQPTSRLGATPPVRDAGASAMRDKPTSWSKTDEEMDQSFPASDAPGNY